MAEHPDSHIHFVDVLPHLINEVEKRLITQLQKNWTTHCLDATAIKLEHSSSHLVIIAGVGGDLLIDMVDAIISNHSTLIEDRRLDFILCPVRQLHKVREGLNRLQLGLVSEQIVKDNNQFYEVIQVSNQSRIPLSLVGDIMWNTANEEHQAYRNAMITHYQKQPSHHAKKLLRLYQDIC
jgi:tRNA (adenine22-N1)-methyltransferase